MSGKQASARSEPPSSNNIPSPSVQAMSAKAGTPGEDAQSDLERLREILYGHYARLLDKRLAEIEARLDRLQAEMQRRDDELRQELLQLIAALDKDKASRHDVGQMFIELGQRLGNTMRPGDK